MKHIKTKKGLQTLLKRYEEAGASEYWLRVVSQCIEQDLAMDEDDYENTEPELRKCWRGLK